jgi:hypothetical protein
MSERAAFSHSPQRDQHEAAQINRRAWEATQAKASAAAVGSAERARLEREAREHPGNPARGRIPYGRRLDDRDRSRRQFGER